MEFCINKQPNFVEEFQFCGEMVPSCYENRNILVAPRSSCPVIYCRDPRIPPQAEMFSCFCPPTCDKCCCENSKCKKRKSKSSDCLCLNFNPCRRESFRPIYTCKIPNSPPSFETLYTRSFKRIL